LALLVPWVVAHDVNDAAPAHNLTAFTDALDAGADLHGGKTPRENDRINQSESV
jgi:hypothetical protein